MRLLLGDCLDKLKELDDNSVDSIVTDPPYGIAFMAKKWDYDVPSQAIWEECMRVLKPGGHLLSFAGSRTYHRMAVRIEDAGFEIRDQIMWIYGSGFPKSHDVGKNIEKIKVGGKANLTQVGTKKGLVATNHNDKAKSSNPSGFSYRTNQKGYSEVATDRTQVNGEIPVYEITNDYKGWGTALKPAHEPIVMARKPLIGTVADNVLEWGVGGINIDGCRIGEGTGETKTITQKGAKFKTWSDDPLETRWHEQGFNKSEGNSYEVKDLGRFPANIILDEEAGKILDEQSGNKTGQRGVVKGTEPSHSKKNAIYGDYSMVEGKFAEPIDELGGASRFFYCPKASKSDRDEGLTELQTNSKIGATFSGNQNVGKIGANPNKPTQPRANIHPTVKPTELMKYLIRLVTPKGGVVLDPFMGSGSTGKAAVREGMEFIGIEREEEYYEIAKQRIENETNKRKFW
jgi:site-specific DNA-methyltransferase (adenine-specific)